MDRTADLLARAAAGDTAAFDRLFARVLPRLQWFVEVRIGPELRARVEPMDVVQDTYVTALARLAEFEPRGAGSFLRWLFAIAGNRVLRSAEREGAGHRRAVSNDTATARILALTADTVSGPCTRAERLEVRARLCAALAALDPDARTAITTRLLEGRPLVEVAGLLGRSESATRRLVADTLARLGRALGEQTPGGRGGAA